MEKLKSIELFMLDLDGTIYHENELIPGTMELLRFLESKSKHYVFMTNNSSKSKFSYLEKLRKLGIKASEDQIASSINTTLMYLNSHKKNAKLFLIGTDSFKQELEYEGFNVVPLNYRDPDIDYVLLGFDTELNYDKITGACYYISRGYKYIATNCDLRCPIGDNKYIPDCGAIAKLIEFATDRVPLFLGKPAPTIVNYVSKKWKVHLNKMACVGDRLYTDIAVGKNAGITTICVLTGEATPEEIETSGIYPDYCFDSIEELYLAIR